MLDLTCSLVCYNNDRAQLLNAIRSFISSDLGVELHMIDNSSSKDLENLISDSTVRYMHNPSNPGFGAGHNIAINKIIDRSRYHLILNPDIYFNSKILNEICNYMDENPDIGVLMPKILYPDDSIQYVAKLLPSPMDFIIRRFIPFKGLKGRLTDRFELRLSGYNKVMNVPFLSGCFMVFRTDVLKKIHGFDDSIFMYTEDIDICRRVIRLGFRSVFYPKVHVYHDHEKKSFSNLRTFTVYFKSAVYYFNKWGWFFDRDRKKINRETLDQIS